MQVNELAKATNTKPQAIRFYARIGLITPIERESNGYRRFPSQAVQRIRFIKAAQAVGLKLSVIQALLNKQRPGPDCCGVTSHQLRKRLEEITQAIENLTALKERLARLLSMWGTNGCAENGIDKCPKLFQNLALVAPGDEPEEPGSILARTQRSAAFPSAGGQATSANRHRAMTGVQYPCVPLDDEGGRRSGNGGGLDQSFASK